MSCGIFCEQLVEIENGRDLAAELEERRQQLGVRDRAAGGALDVGIRIRALIGDRH